MTIQFNTISSTLRKPSVLAEIDSSGASGLSKTPAKILVIGQMSPSGTATANEISTAITSAEQAESLFGAGSMIHRMIRAALYSDNRSYLYALPIADPTSGSDFALGSITVSGTATASNTEYLYAAADKTYGRVSIPIAKTNSAETVAGSIRSTINAYGAELATGSLTAGEWYEITAHDSVDFTSDGSPTNTVGQVFRASSATVTLSSTDKVKPVSNKHAVLAYILDGAETVVRLIAKNKGALGNDIPLMLNYRGVAGGESATPGITMTVSAMASGTSQPDLTTALSGVEGKQYDAIICPYTDSSNVELLEALMTSQWEPDVALYGHCYQAISGSFGTISSWGNSQNSEHISTWASYGQLCDPAVVAASCGSVVAAELVEHPARPCHNLRIKALYAPQESERFTPEEANLLYFDGMSPLEVTVDGGVKTDRVITMKQLSDAGTETDSWLDVNVPAVLSYFNKYMVSKIQNTYPRSILVSDSTPVGEGSVIVRPRDIKNLLIGAYEPLVTAGICQSQDHFAATLVAEIDASDTNRVNISMQPVLAGQLFVCAIKNVFRKTA